jgi:uncharacterized protein YkwD
MRKFFLLFIIIFAVLWMTATTMSVPKQGELEDKSYQLFTLINQERQRLNIPILIWDSHLVELATLHSQHMADTNDYRHSSYGYAENIMIGTEPKEVYTAWENSSLHYANMTNPSLTYGGIGMGIKLTNITIGSINITVNTSRSYTTLIMSDGE